MKIFRFRVLLEHGDDCVSRDIDVPATGTLLDLHNGIQKAFGFDNSQMTSFYLSDEDWQKGEEITLDDMNEPGGVEEIRMMKEVEIGATLNGENDRLLYVFDFMSVWVFYVELVKVFDSVKKAAYPLISNVIGKAPNQYSKTEAVEDEEDEILAALREANIDSDEEPFEDDLFEDFDEFD